MLKGLNDFLDKHEGREVGSSTRAIKKERKRQGYDKSTPKSKALGKIPKHIHEAREKRFMENYNKDRDRNFK